MLALGSAAVRQSVSLDNLCLPPLLGGRMLLGLFLLLGLAKVVIFAFPLTTGALYWEIGDSAFSLNKNIISLYY